MTRDLLTTMIVIVDAKMESFQNDFYKVDLSTLYKYESCDNYSNDNIPEFFWEVNKSHTHLSIVDEAQWKKWIDDSDALRFRLGREKDYPVGSFMYWVKNYDRLESDGGSDFYHYNPETKKLELIPTFEVKDAVLKAWEPIIENLYKYLCEHYGAKEGKYWNTHVPVRFADERVFNRCLQLVTEHKDGRQLLKRLKGFRNYQRLAINHQIVIGNDWELTDFTFSEQINDKCRLFGGIIYSEASGWSMHT